MNCSRVIRLSSTASYNYIETSVNVAGEGLPVVEIRRSVGQLAPSKSNRLPDYTAEEVRAALYVKL